jgi:MFS family permease
MLALVGLAEFLAMTPWFAATAVMGDLFREFHLNNAQTAWLAMAVQGGFVVGTLASAVLGLPDVVSARWVFAVGSLVAGLANAMTTVAASPVEAVAWRFVTGGALALVYPPGMKVVAGWFAGGRGVGLGVLVACLTMGKAMPYLFAALWPADWRLTVVLSSGLCMAGGLLMLLTVRDGPHVVVRSPFTLSAIGRVFSQRATRLAVLGYLGHMWELYASWTWFGVFVTSALVAQGNVRANRLGAVAAFVALAAGALGCVSAGVAADRHGRARVAAWAMMVSASCCALTAPAFVAPFPVLLALAVVWGFSIVADSALFSVIVSETSPPEYVGTALTLQTCLGFLLTMLAIHLVSAAASRFGWQWAFLVVLPGPVLGVQAMLAIIKPRVTRID